MKNNCILKKGVLSYILFQFILLGTLHAQSDLFTISPVKEEYHCTDVIMLKAKTEYRPGFTIVIETDGTVQGNKLMMLKPINNEISYTNIPSNSNFTVKIDSISWRGDYFFKYVDPGKNSKLPFRVFNNVDKTIILKDTMDLTATGESELYEISSTSITGVSKYQVYPELDVLEDLGNGVAKISFSGYEFLSKDELFSSLHIFYHWNSGAGINTSNKSIKFNFPQANASMENITYSKLCEGDSVQLGGNPTASGGDGKYLYQWSPADSLKLYDVPNPFLNLHVTGDEIRTINYALTLTDGNGAGCKISDEISVSVFDSPTLSLGVSDPGCHHDNNSDLYSNAGKIAINISEGNEPYTFFYSGDDFTQGYSDSILEKKDFLQGSYTVYATGENNCNSNSVDFEIIEPDPITFSVNASDNNNCYGDETGQISITASGGTGTLKYAITTEGDFEYSPTSSFANLPGGDYRVRVRDSYYCWDELDTMVEITNINPLQVSVGTASYDIKDCPGGPNGRIKINVRGGTKFSSGSEYLVAIYQDGELPFYADSTYDALYAGTYFVSVKDANGCLEDYKTPEGEKKAIQLNDYYEPLEINRSTFSVPQINSCFGKGASTIGAYATGMSGNLIYTLVSDDTTYQQEQPVFENIPAGSYHLTIADKSHGCDVDTSFVIDETSEIKIKNASSTEMLTCYGDRKGIISANISGGSPPYFTYLFQQGETEPEKTNIVEDGQLIFEKLQVGKYDILIQDKQKCEPINNFPAVEILQPDSLQFSFDTLSIVNNDGTVDYSLEFTDVTGGVDGYMYSVYGGLKPSEDPVFEVLPGDLILVIEDGNGCQSRSVPITIIKNTSSIHEVSTENNALKIHPNPVEDMLSFHVPLNCIGLKATISTSTGQIISAFTLDGSFNMSNVSDLGPGVYILSIPKMNKYSRFVKVK